MTVTYDIGRWNTNTIGVTIYINIYDNSNNLLQSFNLYGQNDVISGDHAQGTMCTNKQLG